MSTPYVGEIKLVPYNFTPIDWLPCDGSLLSIAEFEVLYQLIGTTYGGDGQTTFAVPDLRGRIAMHMGNGYFFGEQVGVENVTLTDETMPQHAHALSANDNPGTLGSPSGNYPAGSPDGLGFVYAPFQQPEATAMNANSIASAGGSQPHPNIQPYLSLTYIIAAFGVFPSQG